MSATEFHQPTKGSLAMLSLLQTFTTRKPARLGQTPCGRTLMQRSYGCACTAARSLWG